MRGEAFFEMSSSGVCLLLFINTLFLQLLLKCLQGRYFSLGILMLLFGLQVNERVFL